MSLYVRVQSSFWTNRKTLRLRVILGNDAFWIPPRLWSYAAENQPDGDFEDYSAEELAMLLGYNGNAQAMLEALQQAGFLDGKVIHAWEEHNDYHRVYSERAKKAAQAKWEALKEKKQKKEEYRRRIDKNRKEQASSSNAYSNASSIPGPNGPIERQIEEEIYFAYPKHEGKDDAIRAIQKRIKEGKDPNFLLDRTKAYARAIISWQERKFIPHPSTWFNKGKFDDDPSCWNDPGKPKPQPKPREFGF